MDFFVLLLKGWAMIRKIYFFKNLVIIHLFLMNRKERLKRRFLSGKIKNNVLFIMQYKIKFLYKMGWYSNTENNVFLNYSSRS